MKQQPDIEAGMRITGARVAIVAARFNEAVVEGLVEGARRALAAHGVDERDIILLRVPGAWELPLAAERLAREGGIEAIVALGAVVRGGTPHFEYVCEGCVRGLMDVQLRYALPVAFGVLTCDTVEQAQARAGADGGNKGSEAAHAAVEMVYRLRHV